MVRQPRETPGQKWAQLLLSWMQEAFRMIPMFDEMLQTGLNPLALADARPHYADYAR
jgi:hypothetical protein